MSIVQTEHSFLHVSFVQNKTNFYFIIEYTQSYNIRMNYLIIRCVTFSAVLSRINSKYLTNRQRSILKYDSLDNMFLLCLLFYIKCNNNNNNNNNNCLKSNIQCIEIRVQWTVHLGSSHMHVHAVTRVHAVTPKLVICVMYLTSI